MPPSGRKTMNMENNNIFLSRANIFPSAGSIYGLITVVLLLAGCADSGLGGLVSKKHVILPEDGKEKIIPVQPVIKSKNTITIKPEKVKPQTMIVKPSSQELTAFAFIDKRAKACQAELTKWRQTIFVKQRPPEGWNECLMVLDRISRRYRVLQHKIMTNHSLDITNEYPRLLEDDIIFQASPCNGLDQQTTGVMEKVARRELVTALIVNSKQGNYQEVVLLYNRLSAVSDDHISPKIKELYAEAQLKNNNPAAAARIFVELNKKCADFSPMLMGQLAARLFLAAGNMAAAGNEYKNLLDYYTGLQGDEIRIREQLSFLQDAEQHQQELNWFSAVLRGSLSFNGRHLSKEMTRAMTSLDSNYPQTIFTEKAREIYAPCEERMRTWVAEQLALAEKLMVEKKFTRAREILSAVSNGPLPFELEEQVVQFAEQIRLAKEKEKKTRQQLIEHARDIQWEEGIKLLDNRQYDEAIAVFTALLDSAYHDKAEKRLLETKRQAAVNLRRKSAGLFIKARNTADPLRRGELLLEARRILLEILKKYPQVDITAKVKQNLKVIEEDIFQLNPQLLDSGQTSVK